MEFPLPLVRGRFLRREKRFFIHAVLDDGTEVVAPTERGRKHLRELQEMVAAGVEVVGVRAQVEPQSIVVKRLIELEFKKY